MLTLAALIPLGVGCVTTSNAEPVIGQFELKTLESAPGSIELQSQNAWSSGYSARQVASNDSGEPVFDGNAVVHQRHALEIEAGFTSWLKMRAGIEFERERIDDPDTVSHADTSDDLQLTEVGLELVAILVQRPGDGTGFGVVVEVERPTDDDEPDTLILGTIVEFQSGRWFAAAIPMVARTFGGHTDDGEPSDDKWDFTYAAQLRYALSEEWLLALEGYGTVERISDSGNPSESAQLFGDFDQHRAGLILYYEHEFGCPRCRHPLSPASSSSDSGGTEDGVGLSIGFGLLAGLNDDTPDQTLKLSIELSF